MGVERVVVLVEEHRLLRDGRADLLGVLAVVEAHADDLLGPGDDRPVPHRRLLQEGWLRRAALQGRCDEGLQVRPILVL